MSQIDTDSIAVVGGVYRELCMRPSWREIYGSAGRAASAIASMGGAVTLHACLDPLALEVMTIRAALECFALNATETNHSVTFEYDHGLSTPRIHGIGSSTPTLLVEAGNVLRFGVIEGDAVTHGGRVVYDPQDAVSPQSYYSNGSTAKELALILNRLEAELLTGLKDASVTALAESLLESKQANVVIIKQGAQGALVHDGYNVDQIPAYLSQNVWKIGSGDTFVGHFAYRWMHEGRSAAASADLASRATAYYCQTRGFPTPESLTSFNPRPVKPSLSFCRGEKPRVYLAGPFFTLAQLWLIEQARRDLYSMGMIVFSPYHEVGHGSAEDVVKLDLEGIDNADIVFAIGDGMDAGTVYEIGYARAKGKPVVMYCENESAENKKMMEGSDCQICADYVSAIYRTLWVACSA
jgi:hypothetical protein